MKAPLAVSVRDLVGFTLRSGDLTFGFAGSRRAVDAIAAHQRLQRSRPAPYTPEVPVSREVVWKGRTLVVGGRIDGVYAFEEKPVVEEIKTTVQDLERVAAEHNPLHWGQLKTYAHLYAAEHGLPRIDTCLTYVHLETGETAEITAGFDAEALERFVADLVDRYLDWAYTLRNWRAIRDDSIQSLHFPYPEYRPGQRSMAVAVYRAVRDERQMFVQAATGIGKTIAALFPSIKAMGEDRIEKIFYLTARTTARTAAESAVETLRESGLRIKMLSLTAKDKICFHPGGDCTPDACEYARGHFDRINDALAAAYAEDGWTRIRVDAIARRHRVCPFDLSLELALWSDLVICDYNYAFDPRVYLRRFFLETEAPYAFLIDEAHNLVDRSREMFSAEIRKQPFLDVRRRIKSELPTLFTAMGRVNAWLVRARKRCAAHAGFISEPPPPEEGIPLLRGFVRVAEGWLSKNIPTDFRESLLELYFSATAFLRIADQYDAGYTTCYEQEGRDLRVKLFCLDPSNPMRAALMRCRSAVFFSATLSPVDYFREVLGAEETADAVALPSPFPPTNLAVIAASTISTLYRHRDQTAAQVGQILRALARQKTGNYLFFFPSYAYMHLVYDHFVADADGMEVLVQTAGMAEAEREQFLSRFGIDNRHTRVGFAVMGGIFGEGIDLTGDRLSGAAIVGVGLPGIDPERELIRDYFSQKNGKGFDFAYRFPGINRVCQAAGRVIRSETDRGVVLLVDRRFASRRYRDLLPSTWRPTPVGSSRAIERVLTRFWRRGA